MAEPHWVDRMIEEVTSTILAGLDHTLSHAPARILLAKGSLIRLTAAVRRWARPKVEILSQVQADIEREMQRRAKVIADSMAEVSEDLRGEQSSARREMYKEQSAAWAEQAFVWADAQEIVRKVFDKAKIE